MSIQVGYKINHPLDEQEVGRIKDYITGKLCDIYGARTGIHRGRAPETYIIERLNRLPILPRVDKILELNIDRDSTIINCYFSRCSWVNKFKKKLENLIEGSVSIIDVDWRIIDIQRRVVDLERILTEN